MIACKDIRDYIATLQIAEDEHCYMGLLPEKKEKSIGIYPAKSGRRPVIPIGGRNNCSYERKDVTLLVHWNESPTETEAAAMALYQKLHEVRMAKINGYTIKFFLPEEDAPVPVGVDEEGIFEYVISCMVYTAVEAEQEAEQEEPEQEAEQEETEQEE